MITVILAFKDRVLKEIKSRDKEITIGRDIDNVIHIDNPAVSKHHARIVRQGYHFYIEDLNSTNGTYINEKPVSWLALRDEDEISIGKHTLKIYLEETRGWCPCKTGKEKNRDETMALETKAHKERHGSHRA